MASTTGRKKTTPTKRSATTLSRSSTSSKNSRIAPTVSLSSVFHTLKNNPLGRVLLISLAAAVIIGINFLISFNLMDRFFIAIGIEFILLVLIGWVRFVLRGKAEEDS